MGLGAIGDVFVNLYKTIREDQAVQKWFTRADAWMRFWSSMAVSCIISFCGVSGLAMMALPDGGLVKALGAGLFAIAAACFGVCSVSPLGRDLIQSLPKAFITQMQEHPDQVTIVGSEAEKK